MKSRFLFPPVFKVIGWILALPGLVLGYLNVEHNFRFSFLQWGRPETSTIAPGTFNFTDEAAITMVIFGLIFVAFSKRKIEDELVSRLRMDALYWSILINSLIYFVLGLVSDADLINYNICTPILIFIIRFNYLLHFKKDTFVVNTPRFLPYKPWRILAVAVAIVSLLVIILSSVFEYNLISEGMLDVIYYTLFGSLLVWTYSLNSFEDELTMQHRLDSMYLAVLINYSLLLVATYAVYSLSFLIILVINLISTLLIFVVLFSYYSMRNRLKEEKQLLGGFAI
ncbi:hypothetical protein [Hufsiella ginkgonis]|uniref:Uncharacterized protein n=1 Tax=Hufsiella ginkgonis TaxID=2695274 RepID=A0A7K1XV69_9SPHI|nr:hypothetical protein [Hufsiella ginkgonis]MXV14905.1 hypothetical protein [Hufsiella ginkgonis]